MGIIFKNASSDTTGVVVDLDKAVRAACEGKIMQYVAAVGGLQPPEAEVLCAKVRAKDAALAAAIRADVVKAEADASALLRADDAAFPAATFVACVKEAVGSKVTPATWSEVVAAAKAEAVAEPIELGGK